MMMLKMVMMRCWIGVPKRSDLHFALMEGLGVGTVLSHSTLGSVFVYIWFWQDLTVPGKKGFCSLLGRRSFSVWWQQS